jgi:hypothetical protein
MTSSQPARKGANANRIGLTIRNVRMSLLYHSGAGPRKLCQKDAASIALSVGSRKDQR